MIFFQLLLQDKMEKTLPSLAKKVAPKTFINDSSDSYISTVLKDHGWTQVQKTNISWQLKWTWKPQPKDMENQHPLQVINHFPGIEQLTTKIGLAFSLKRNHSISDDGKSYSTFFPRSYNLVSQYQEFVQDYQRTAVLNLVKKIVACLQLYYNQQFHQIKASSKKITTNCIDGQLSKLFENNTVFRNEQQGNSQVFSINGQIFVRLLFYLQHIFSLDNFFEFTELQLKELMQYSERQIPFQDQNDYPTNQALALLLSYHKKCLFSYPSYFQDGFGNVWIVKSNYSSRGRSINLIQNLNQLRYLSNGMKLIQKYIENVWVLHHLTMEQKEKYPYMEAAIGRKFDIRVWVLVVSFTPLEVYIYDEGYLRLSRQNYQLDTISDNTCHLTNYSTNWRKGKLKDISSDSSFILLSQYLEYLRMQESVDVGVLRKKIQTICLETIRTVQIKQNSKSFELLGFDILLDAQCNPWLIQCNLSPSCAPRGQLSRVAKQMATGMFAILGLIDDSYHEWRLLARQSFSHKKSSKLIESKKKRGSLRMATQYGWSQNPLNIKAIKWNKYRNIERFHFVVEKIKLIQYFYRKRIKGRKLEHSKGNFIKMIQILAKIHKKTLNKHFKTFTRKLKRRYSKIKTSE